MSCRYMEHFQFLVYSKTNAIKLKVGFKRLECNTLPSEAFNKIASSMYIQSVKKNCFFREKHIFFEKL